MGAALSRYYCGRLRTEAGIARQRETARRRNARRVQVGRLYVGMAPTEDSAKQLNDETRRHFSGR